MRSQYHLGQVIRLVLDFLDDEARRLDPEEESDTPLDKVTS